MLKDIVLQDPEVARLSTELQVKGLDPYALIDEAIAHFTRDLNPGPQILIALVKGFLVAKLKAASEKPATTFFGRLWRSIFR